MLYPLRIVQLAYLICLFNRHANTLPYLSITVLNCIQQIGIAFWMFESNICNLNYFYIRFFRSEKENLLLLFIYTDFYV